MKIKKFLELRQTYFWGCGAKAMQAVLAYYGIDVHEEAIMKLAGTTKTGTPVKGLKKVVKKYGLKCEAGKMTIEEVKNYIKKRIPVIILLQVWTIKENVDWGKHWTDGHYAVVVGYNKKKMYFEDPQTFFRTYLTYKELEERWHDKIDGKKYLNFGLAIYGKKSSYNSKKAVHMD